jgi:hypothetical protein
MTNTYSRDDLYHPRAPRITDISCIRQEECAGDITRRWYEGIRLSPAAADPRAQDCFEQAGESVVDILVAEGIQQSGALAASSDKARFSQDAKMMRKGRSHVERCSRVRPGYTG